MPGDERLVVPKGFKACCATSGQSRFVIPPPGNPKLAVPPGNPKRAVDVTDRDQNWLEAIKPYTWPWEQKSQQDAAKKDRRIWLPTRSVAQLQQRRQTLEQKPKGGCRPRHKH